MRILFVTHRLPCPPDRGCKIRSAALLYGLARRHDVWCVGFLDNANTPELRSETRQSIAALRQMCRGLLAVPFSDRLAGSRALGGLIAGGTATESYFASRILEQGLSAWSEEIRFDAVFAFSSGIAPLAWRVAAPRRVLCMDDLDSRKWQELAANAHWPMSSIYRLEARRLAERERYWLARFDATLMVSQREADLVTEPQLRAKVHVIPPVLPGWPDCDDAAAVSFKPPVVGFLGAMDYPPNVDAACWLARDIWPLVLDRHPDARLFIVGRSPVPAVRDLGSDESIVVTGTVPDVRRYLSAMRVHVAPLRVARGVQIKVLTAMAAGRPCVVTSCVAEGLGAQNGRDLIVADTAADIAAAVVRLLDNPQQAQALGQAGQRFVRQFDLDEVVGRIERLLAGGEAAAEAPPLAGANRRETRVQKQPQREPALVGKESRGKYW